MTISELISQLILIQENREAEDTEVTVEVEGQGVQLEIKDVFESMNPETGLKIVILGQDTIPYILEA